MDEDFGFMKKSFGGESEEHMFLKLLAFKELRNKGFMPSDILIEEIDDESKLIPDLNIHHNIWVEIETLLGSKTPNFLISEKFSKKKDEIRKCKEFWLIIPNFELFMHRKTIMALKRQLINTLGKLIKIKIFGADFYNKQLSLFY